MAANPESVTHTLGLSLRAKPALGDRWFERIRSFRQTARRHIKSAFAVLVDALGSYFKEPQSDLARIKVAV